VEVGVDVRNEGDVVWPAVPLPVVPLQLDIEVPDQTPARFQVVLQAEWRRLDANGATGPVVREKTSSLDRDVDPGDTLRRTLLLHMPEEEGRYELAISVRQIDGPRLDAPAPSSRIILPVARAEAPAPPAR
jgi:hypothetical protein